MSDKCIDLTLTYIVLSTFYSKNNVKIFNFNIFYSRNVNQVGTLRDQK